MTGVQTCALPIFVVAIYYALTFVDVGGERRFALYVTGGPGMVGGQGAILKLGIVGGVVVLESLVLRRQPSTKF